MNFLPADYKIPSSSNCYLKLQEGENKFRILSKPILGWEDWTMDKKPVRFTMDEKPAKPIVKEKPLKHFWAFIVYNYSNECVQIMQVTQNSIRKSIEALCRDTDWGDPYYYDIKITKTGSNMDTEYKVNPVPHKPIDPAISVAFKNTPIWLDALFASADPFSSEWKHYTPMAHEGDDDDIVVSKPKTITDQQAEELEKMILECEPKIQTRMWTFIEKDGNGRDLSKMTLESYSKIKTIVMEKRQQYQYTLMKDEPQSMDEVKDEQ